MTIPDAGAVRPTTVRWRVLLWIVVASVIAYVLRFNLSVAGHAMMRDLGLSEAQLGIVLGAFAWSYGLFQAPGGVLGERFGPRRTMTWMFIAWFATTAMMAMVPRGWPVVASVTLLVVLRAAQGMVQAPLFPVTAGGSQSATGMLNTGGNFAGGVGAMLVPVIAGSFGWTTAVASGAIFSVVAAALWLGVRPDLALQSRAVVAPGVTPALVTS